VLKTYSARVIISSLDFRKDLLSSFVLVYYRIPTLVCAVLNTTRKLEQPFSLITTRRLLRNRASLGDHRRSADVWAPEPHNAKSTWYMCSTFRSTSKRRLAARTPRSFLSPATLTQWTPPHGDFSVHYAACRVTGLSTLQLSPCRIHCIALILVGLSGILRMLFLIRLTNPQEAGLKTLVCVSKSTLGVGKAGQCRHQ
jgi:hypothetical protein